MLFKFAEGGIFLYTTEVKTAVLPVKRWLEDYCFPQRFQEACRACPDYGRLWSCPPDVPAAKDAFAPYKDVHIIGLLVHYDQETIAAAVTPEETERLRQESYGVVKKSLLSTLLELETLCPGSWTVAAGRCEQCGQCTRPEGLPCRRPERMRYSFSAFGFDLGKMAEELLGVQLLWTPQGLPAYDTALAAFLEP